MTKETIGDCTIYNGDCLEIMPTLESASIDLVLTDPPYGTTACKWDSIISFDNMWNCINKVSKETTPICLFGSEPFSSALRMSNIKNYKYDWIWYKNLRTGFLNAKYKPMRSFENISVFYKKQGTYNPIMKKRTSAKRGKCKNEWGDCYGNPNNGKDKPDNQTDFIFPHDIIEGIKCVHTPDIRYHPTQKPTDLLEYLIKTYTNEGDLVLDFTSGSFSTAIACLNTKRKFIGIELDTNYYEIGKKRIIEWYENQKSIFDI